MSVHSHPEVSCRVYRVPLRDNSFIGSHVAGPLIPEAAAGRTSLSLWSLRVPRWAAAEGGD